MKDYYKILGIPRSSSKSEIIKAFRSLAKQTHPDLNKSIDSRRFIEIYEAYEILKDDKRRIAYDKLLNVEINHPAPAFAANDPWQANRSTFNYEYQQYDNWASSANQKAQQYSRMSYSDFFKSALKKSYELAITAASGILGLIIYLILYAIIMLVNFFELMSTIAIGILAPAFSFSISTTQGFISIAVAGLFAWLYFSTTVKFERFWIFIKEGKRFVFVKSIAYLAFLTYAIFIFITFKQGNNIDHQVAQEQSIYYNNSLPNGSTPYAAYYDDFFYNGYGPYSEVIIRAPINSDVLVTLKQSFTVIKHAYIKAGYSFSLKVPNGTYQPFFYYGKGWDPNKEMKTSSKVIYGGFTSSEHFGKDEPQRLFNNILEYELILQTDGNFSTKPSNPNEAL